MSRIAVLSVVLAFLILSLIGCGAREPEAIEKIVTVPVEVTVPVVQTQVVIHTREAPRTVVVTATPVPTPTYAPLVNVQPGVLVYPLASDPLTVDPQEASDEVSGLVVQQLYEGLFHLRGDGSVVPAAATGYQVAADGKTYTITLRSGMKWSDGAAVTAQHYVDGVCQLLDPATGNSYYYLLSEVAGIRGAHDFASGATADCKKVGVRAVDDLTLQIALDRPAAFFPKLLAFRTFLPARGPAAAAATPDRRTPTATTPDRRTPTVTAAPAVGGQSPAVVNGPYLLSEWQPDRKLTLVKNEGYWNAAAVTIQRIEFVIASAPASQFALYEKGQAHVAEAPPEQAARIQADANLKRELQVLVRPGVSYIGLNTQAGPTKNLAFRRAIASAIDRERLIGEVLKQPWHKPARSVIPPDILGYQGDDPAVGYSYDPERAKKLLVEAGYGPDRPVPPVEIWVNREGNNLPLFQAIGEMLEKVGIPVRLNSSKWDVYLAALDDCNRPNRSDATKTPAECAYSLYRMGWVMDYADPAGILDVVFSPRSAFQYTGWQSKEYTDLLARALVEQDEKKRGELYKSAEKILLQEAAVVAPLQYYDRTVLVKTGVTFEYPAFGPPNLQYWRLP